MTCADDKVLGISDTTATFDHLGRMLTKVENPGASSGAQTTTYTYDADGRQLSLTDTAGHTTSSSYDPLGRVVGVTHPDGTQDTTTYDAAGHQLSQANASGTTSDAYDALGRLSSEQQLTPSGTLLSTVTYSYDADGNKLSQTTTPAGGGGSPATTSWSYDKLDRTAAMSDGTRSYAYDALGNVTQMQVYNSGTQTVQSQYQYDGGNRLTSLKDFVGAGSSTPLHSYAYGYDAAGNRNSITEDGTTSTFTYDGANQLLSVSSGGVTQTSYSYDANHNRTQMVTPAGTTTYTYDTAATDTLLQQKTDPNGKVTTYAYDANGNLLTATYDPTGANQVTTYHYDSSNRLTEVDEPTGTTVTFAYDANGQRDQKTVTTGGSNPTTYQVNDTYQNGRLASQSTLGGTLLATFTYDPSGIPESVVVGSDPVNSPRYYYVYNGHGDVVALTDASGTVVASYTYDVWGNLTSASESIPNANGWSNPYRYDGKDGARYDLETGLYWLSTRAYDPSVGRFVQRDPLGRAPLLFADQPYAYAGNNPLVNTDPSGELIVRPNGGSMSAAQQAQAVRYTQRVARIQARRVPQCLRKCWAHRASVAAGVTANHLALLSAAAFALAGGLAFFSWVMTTWGIPWLLSLAASSSFTIFGAAFFLVAAAVVTALAFLAREAARQLAVLGGEAAILAGLFGEAAGQGDDLTYGYVTGWWKTAVVGTLVIGTGASYLVGLLHGLDDAADAIRAVAGQLNRGMSKELFQFLAALTATGVTALSFAGVASITYSGLYQLEGYLR